MQTIFLYTFYVGFGLTAVSALLGALDISGLGHHGDAGDFSAGHHGDAGGHGIDGVATVSPVNFQTIVGFMMGFGGLGYLATRFGWGAALLAVPAALAGGLGTATLALKWLRFLKRGERPLPPTSYVGVVGKLTLGIREGGTGELVYTLHDTRQVLAARSEDGRPIPRGHEVVVLRYDKGIAYVESVFGAKEE